MRPKVRSSLPTAYSCLRSTFMHYLISSLSQLWSSFHELTHEPRNFFYSTWHLVTTVSTLICPSEWWFRWAFVRWVFSAVRWRSWRQDPWRGHWLSWRCLRGWSPKDPGRIPTWRQFCRCAWSQNPTTRDARQAGRSGEKGGGGYAGGE